MSKRRVLADVEFRVMEQRLDGSAMMNLPALASWSSEARRSAILFGIAAYAFAEPSDASALSLFPHGGPILANAAARCLLFPTNYPPMDSSFCGPNP